MNFISSERQLHFNWTATVVSEHPVNSNLSSSGEHKLMLDWPIFEKNLIISIKTQSQNLPHSAGELYSTQDTTFPVHSTPLWTVHKGVCVLYWASGAVQRHLLVIQPIILYKYSVLSMFIWVTYGTYYIIYIYIYSRFFCGIYFSRRFFVILKFCRLASHWFFLNSITDVTIGGLKTYLYIVQRLLYYIDSVPFSN